MSSLSVLGSWWGAVCSGTIQLNTNQIPGARYNSNYSMFGEEQSVVYYP